MDTKAKICGLQKLDDALTAASCGADFIGFVFVPNRKRRINMRVASEIIEHLKLGCERRPEIVGVFADQSVGEVNEHVRFLNLDKVQLSGSESTEFCSKVSVPVIKVIHIPGIVSITQHIDAIAAKIDGYVNKGHLIALDRQVDKVRGGTGKSFNWSIASELSGRGYKFILAGGLTHVNLPRAMDIAVPWAVDVSSGVETDGEKDSDKIRAFISIAHATKMMDVQK
jgi:phosphoribosylanthranilate isomerase